MFGLRKDMVTKNLTCEILILLLVLTILFIAINEKNDSSQAVNELKIVEAEEALGSVEGVNNTSIQAYTYDFLLYNSGNEDIYLNSVVPLFTKDFSARILTEDHVIVGNNTLKSNSTIHIKGQVKFNASGLSNEQDSTLARISSVNVTLTKTLPFFKENF
jgi:hypothetical protein